jgi:hypothetical protein
MRPARKAVASVKPATRKSTRLRAVPPPVSAATPPPVETGANTASRTVARATSFEEMWWYQLALFQRSVLFLDTLQERANNMLSDEQAGLPWMIPFGLLAPHLQANPRGTAPDNPWMQFEQLLSQSELPPKIRLPGGGV